jgi:tryptophan-rich sensory protein
MDKLAGQPSELRRDRMRGREDVLATGVVAGVTALTAIGSRISSNYDSAWFRALRKPRWEPSGAVIGPVWAVLYACTGLSATLLWREREAHDLRGLMGLRG